MGDGTEEDTTAVLDFGPKASPEGAELAWQTGSDVDGTVATALLLDGRPESLGTARAEED